MATAFHRYVWVLRDLRALARNDLRTHDLFKRVADLEIAFFARSRYADDNRLLPEGPRTTMPAKRRRSGGDRVQRLPLAARTLESTKSNKPSDIPLDRTRGSEREKELEAELLRLYKHVWPKVPIPPGYTRPYYAKRLYQQFMPHCKRYIGGIQAVKSAIRGETSGRERLSSCPELTLESLVRNGKWDDVFDDDDRQIAARKLAGMKRSLEDD